MVPMTFGLFSIISKNLVDTYFVAQLGTEPLSAISFTFPVVMFVMAVSIGLGAGASSVVSRVFGGGDLSLVKRRSTDALVLGLAVAGGVSVVGVLSIRPVFTALGARGAILDHVEAYMGPWFLGLVFLVITMVSTSLLRAAGEARRPGMLMVTAALMNAALDPILIFGGLGAPELGIAGAAWATVISNAVATVGAVVLLIREDMLFLRAPTLAEVRSSWKPLLAVGAPASLANMINPLGVGIVTRLLASIGPETVAGFGVASRLEGLSIVVMLAMSAAVGPVVGQNYGAGEPARVDESLGYCFRLAFIWSTGTAIFLAAAGPFITPLFDPAFEVQRVANLYLWMVPVTYVGYGLNIVQSAAFNALGRPVLANVMTVGRVFLAYVPAALVLSVGFGFGTAGIFAGAMIGNVVGGVAAWLGRRWMRRTLVGRQR
jgi:putative MATE family efflux protein